MRRIVPFAALAIVSAAVACDGLDQHLDCTDPEARGSCSGIDGAVDAPPARDAGPDVVVPADCDLTKDPKDSPTCLADSIGVFVSPTGDDGTAGGKTSPLKTLAKAVELAASRGLPRVYVCDGTYDSNVEITASVSIFGGLSCAWASSDARPKLAPAKGIALRVTAVNGPVQIADIDITGTADANTPGDSAIAAFVSGSTDVKFRRVNLTAGPGTAGAPGSARSNYTGATAASGTTSAAAVPGSGGAATCVDGTSSKGGNGANGAGSGIETGSAVPAVGGNNSGITGLATCTDGDLGANGVAGLAGAPAAVGTLTATGWATPTAIAAPNGKPAQGGGGGGAKTSAMFAGGGGGSGGCGGGGGNGGGSGGSSFALLSFNAQVHLDGGALATGAGSKGGAGGSGQPGQAGGALGVGTCNGGAGGHGAGGSGGGGGAGGHSVPIAFVGAEPTLTGATLTPGIQGTGGGGGNAGASMGNPGPAGVAGPDGKAQDKLPL